MTVPKAEEWLSKFTDELRESLPESNEKTRAIDHLERALIHLESIPKERGADGTT